MAERKGYIYILTNPSFHKTNWIKIGYTEDVQARLKSLYNSSIPLPYEVYATYEVPKIDGQKDPDKLIHDLIMMLNPELRINPNREFFEMEPWDAYDLLMTIASLHGRTDKLVRNKDNNYGVESVSNKEDVYSEDSLFGKDNKETKKLYDEICSMINDSFPTLSKTVTKKYIAFKNGKRNVINIWPRSNCIEICFGAKIGKLSDPDNLLYDISNRLWTGMQYAIKYDNSLDINIIKSFINQIV
jgi:predicted transport protein